MNILEWLHLRKQRKFGIVARSAVVYRSAKLANNQGSREVISIGEHTHIKGEILVFAHGGRIEIGNFCYLGEGSRIWSAGKIHIGNRVLISHNVTVLDNNTHPMDPDQRHAQFREIILSGRHPAKIDLGERPVCIDDDVLIGAQAVVLRGVTIGRGAIVGAGSIVTRDIPPFSVVVGNPAKIVRRIEHHD